MLLKNCKVIVKDNETKLCDILIEDGKIKRIADIIETIDEEMIDLKGKLVMSGGIDVHVHLREPGFESKETIETGTEAALRGGYTTIMAMPNLNPHPDNTAMIKDYLKLIEEKAKVNVIPYANITKDAKGHEVVDMAAINELGIHCFSDDGVGVQSEYMMAIAMQEAYATGSMIVAHTEDNSYLKPKACVNEGKVSKRLGLVGIPNECEYKQIERDLKLAKATGAKYHICHMSAKESVEALRQAKKDGIDASGEVSAHHLVLCEDDIVIADPNFKMNPPLRSKEDKAALVEGVLDGTIEIIANDHAPHTKEDKDKPIDKAAFGIVALETSIPLIYTEYVDKKIFSLELFQNLISKNPAKRFNLANKGELKEGYDADIIVLNNTYQTIDAEKFASKGKNTPFNGRNVKGNIVLTIINGKIKYSSLKGVK